MKCEVCGREARLKRTLIEGVEMMACEECSKYGKVLPERKKVVIKKPKKIVPYSKDVFENMNKELVPEWGTKIREARERKGLTREELGAKVGEKTTTIAKIENEELRPPDETVKRLEKILEINLFHEVESAIVKRKKARPLTLGDLLKNEEE